MPLELGEPRVDLELLLEHSLLDLGDLDPPILDLALDLAAERNRLLARIDLRLTPDRLGLALGVGEQPLAFGPGDAHTRARPAEEHDALRRPPRGRFR